MDLKIAILILGVATGCWGLKFVDPHRYGDGSDDWSSPSVDYAWTTKWTDAMFPVDHFGYTNSDRFKMKYLINDTYYKSGGPIFFYAGNEGSIEGFANATGIMWDLAQQFNAYLLFAEHRYYGDTMPYANNGSWADMGHLGYLTSAQALADYAMFLPWFKAQNNMPNAPVIVFGGSYGGMLATWFRLKYPALTVGAWASSAPVTYFKGGNVDVGAFDKVVMNTYQASGCNVTLLNQAFATITKYGTTAAGLATLNQLFKMNPKTQLKTPDDVKSLKLYLQIGMEYMAMTDYPYETSFLNPMPGWPVLSGCNAFAATTSSNLSDTTLMTGLLSIANIYYNWTGSAPTTCLDASLCGTNPNGQLGGNDPDGWDFQECTEIIIAMCSLGWPNDFFDSDCNATTFMDFQNNLCTGIYGGKVGWVPAFMRVDAVKQLYGWDFSKATNIIFTNGEYDPWSAGGVNPSTPGITGGEARGIYSFKVGGSAHHLDLRQPNSCDPDSVIDVRRQVVQIFNCWLNTNGSGCPYSSHTPPSYTPPATPVSNCQYLMNEYPWKMQNETSPPTVGPSGAPNTTPSGAPITNPTGAPVSPTTSSASVPSVTVTLLIASVIVFLTQ